MRIYVAGPYSAPRLDTVLENVHVALDAGLALLAAGAAPYVPHLTYWLEKRAARTAQPAIPYETYLGFGRGWLQQCHAIVRLARSPGADAEWEYAQALGLLCYEGLDAALAACAAAWPLRPPMQGLHWHAGRSVDVTLYEGDGRTAMVGVMTGAYPAAAANAALVVERVNMHEPLLTLLGELADLATAETGAVRASYDKDDPDGWPAREALLARAYGLLDALRGEGN